VVVFVQKETELFDLLPLLREDLDHILDSSVVVRVDNLPMNSLIEIEIITDGGIRYGDKKLQCQ